MAQIKFGTDGWRARVAREYTFENVERCAAAVAAELIDSGKDERGVVLGYDTRLFSDKFALAAAEKIASCGVDVAMSDRPVPTPSISYSVLRRGAGLGVVITASHNSAEWNGFKVKTEHGVSAPQNMVDRIERRANEGGGQRAGSRAGTVTTFNPLDDYLLKLRELVDVDEIRSRDFTLVIDSMHGAGASILEDLLSGGNLKIHPIRKHRNPAFPGMDQPEPIAVNLKPLSGAIREFNADCGIAFDGDADRLGIVDEKGNFMYCGAVFSLLVHHLLERRAETGSVACSITISSMMEAIGERYGAGLFRTPIGFKHVAPVMQANDCIAGGEESGGYAFRSHIPDRDGIASALLFLEAMTLSGMRPLEMLLDLQKLTGPHSYDRYDAFITPERKEQVRELLFEAAKPTALNGFAIASADETDGIKFFMDDGAWVGCRLSGTEPLVRVYAEGRSPERAAELLQALRNYYGI